MMRNILTVLLILFLCASGCAEKSQKYFERQVPINGTEIFVKTIGHGEPLVFLHGGPGLSHDYFLPHLHPLHEDFNLIFFDQRGMGRSSTDLDSSSFSIELLIEDIEALRTELDLGKIHLLAHSWGGILAMRYAIRYPNSLKSLILSNSISPSSEFDEATISAFSKLNDRQNTEELNTLRDKIRGGSRGINLFERFTQLNFRPLFHDTSRVNELSLNFSDSYFKTQGLLKYLPPPNEPLNLFPDLKEVDVPVLILRGEIEPTPIQSDQKLKETFPYARLVNFSESGHFPFIERQQAFIDSVAQFIDRVEVD